MSAIFEDLFADWIGFSWELKVKKMLEIENLLNNRSGHRYHFRQLNENLFGIYEILKPDSYALSMEKVWVEGLTVDELLIWLNSHLIVRIEERKK